MKVYHMALQFLNVFVYVGITLDVEFVMIPILIQFRVQRNEWKLAPGSLELSRLPHENPDWYTYQGFSLIKSEGNKKV